MRQVFLVCTESTDLQSSNHQSTWPSHHPEQMSISSGFNFKIIQTDRSMDILIKRVISHYLLSFKLLRVFVLIEFQRLMVWFCNLLFTDYFSFRLLLQMARIEIETWKSWANFSTIPAKVTCQLFPFKSFVPLILSKIFKGQWIILIIPQNFSSLSSFRP